MWLAAKCWHQCYKHWIQHSHHGVGQVHLCSGESWRNGASGYYWPERFSQPYQATHLGRFGHHESCQQSYCSERFVLCGLDELFVLFQLDVYFEMKHVYTFIQLNIKFILAAPAQWTRTSEWMSKLRELIGRYHNVNYN